MFINNLGQCEYALYLGCRNCSVCKIKTEERVRAKKRAQERSIQEENEYIMLLEKIERLSLSI